MPTSDSRGILSVQSIADYSATIALDRTHSPATCGIRMGYLFGLLRDFGETDLFTAFQHATDRRDQIGANQKHALRLIAKHQGVVLPGTQKRAFGGKTAQPTAIALSACNFGRGRAIPRVIAEQALWRHLVKTEQGFMLIVTYDTLQERQRSARYGLTPRQLAGLLWLRNKLATFMGAPPRDIDPIFCKFPETHTAQPLDPASRYVFENFPPVTRWPDQVVAEINELADRCAHIASDTEQAQTQRRVLEATRAVSALPHKRKTPSGAIPMDPPLDMADPQLVRGTSRPAPLAYRASTTSPSFLVPPLPRPVPTPPAPRGAPLGADIPDDGGPDDAEYSVEPVLAELPPRPDSEE